MWATLALAAVLQPIPAQTGKLDLTNIRSTYGILGPERKGNKLLPGDLFVVMFDIEGLKVKDTGEVEYSMGVEMKDKAGNKQFKLEPQNLKAFNALGGSRLPAYAKTDIGLDTPAGEYTLIVTVTDIATKETKTIERKFEVEKLEKNKLGIVGLVLTDFQGAPMPPVGVPGQNLFVNYSLVGFAVDQKMNPDLKFEMRILDADGKPTFVKPDVAEVKAANAQNAKRIPNQYQVPLNRSGKYTIELKATDLIANTTVEARVPITVVELPK
jgi:hypothetical protein